MTYQPFQYVPQQVSDSNGASQSILDLIQNRGRIQADAARNSGQIWGNVFNQAASGIGQAIQAYGQQRDQKQVQNAITAATTSQSVDPNNPNAGIESIVGGVSPQLRDKVRAGIGAITKAQQDAAQEQLNTKKMQAELEASNQKAQQGHLDAMAGFGKAVELHFGEKDNGINAAFQGLSMLGSAGNPVAQQYGKFVSDAKQHYDARIAAGDQQGADAVAQEFRAQSQPLIDGGWSRASPDFQKTWMDTQKVKADMAEPDKLIGVPEGGLANSRTGAIVVPGTPKPDSRSIDVRLATTSDPAEYQRLLKVERDKAAAGRDPNARDTLVKVEHKDPATGKTVIEWLPRSQLAGQKFEKGTGATTQSRLASAQAVNQTGEDLIAQLSDPKFASEVGPLMGRYNTLREFIGNPPPQLAELAGAIESYSLANMGVHGMRSAAGAEQIKKLLDARHTPESLIATIRGLNKFSDHFMQNEGIKPTPGATGVTVRTPDGQTLTFPDQAKADAFKKAAGIR